MTQQLNVKNLVVDLQTELGLARAGCAQVDPS